MKIPVAKLIVEKVERPNAAKNLYKILAKELGYNDRYDPSKNKPDKFFPLVWFHEHCDLQKGDRIECSLFVNSNEWSSDKGIEYFPYLSLHEYKKI